VVVLYIIDCVSEVHQIIIGVVIEFIKVGVKIVDFLSCNSFIADCKSVDDMSK